MDGQVDRRTQTDRPVDGQVDRRTQTDTHIHTLAHIEKKSERGRERRERERERRERERERERGERVIFPASLYS